jgi:RimJ/RimL family protein N-acetyltransferase
MRLPPPRPLLADNAVVLRRWSEADASAVASACRDPEIVRWTSQIPPDYTEDMALDWIRSTHLGWQDGSAELAITERATGSVVGAIGLFVRDAWIAELGYWAAPDYRGRGYTTRALLLMTKWGHSLGFQRLQLYTLPGNLASERVAEKASYEREGTLRLYVDQRGTLRDAVMWSSIIAGRDRTAR